MLNESNASMANHSIRTENKVIYNLTQI